MKADEGGLGRSKQRVWVESGVFGDFPLVESDGERGELGKIREIE